MLAGRGAVGGERAEVTGRSGDACPPPGPGPPTSSPLLQGRLRCSSCSLVSDLLREQWGRLSSDWGQGRLVGLQMAPPWPQQQSDPRDTLALTTSAGIALPCSLDGCLRACFLGGRPWGCGWREGRGYWEVWGCLPTSRPWPSHQLTSATGPAAMQFMQPGVRLAEGAVGSS